MYVEIKDEQVKKSYIKDVNYEDFILATLKYEAVKWIPHSSHSYEDIACKSCSKQQ